MRASASLARVSRPALVETRPAASQEVVPGSKRTTRESTAFRRTLLRWYDAHRRDLPWRRTRDPYRIWLSEIMLQQTRVAAVLEHYRLLLKRFPNVRQLAAASESTVLAAWSGLGYYRRARMLHRCAQKIITSHGARFPKNSETLRSLPGIGRYTAAAIASIAFGEPIAVVDGNVQRVLERITGRNLPLSEAWQRAQSLLSASRPGDFNQGLMELGATVCTPRQPKCESCPIRRWCATQGELLRGESEEVEGMERRASRPSVRSHAGASPDLVAASALPRHTWSAGRPCLAERPPRQTKKEIWSVLNQRGGHIRLVQRPSDATQMPGMWELPKWPVAPPVEPQPHMERRASSPGSIVQEVPLPVAKRRKRWVPSKPAFGLLKRKSAHGANLGTRRSSAPAPLPAAQRRKIQAHGVSRGTTCPNDSAPKGRKNVSADPPQTWHTFRHSITTTDYTVHVLRAASPTEGKWIAIERIPELPITGLTRKILKAAGII